MRGHDTSQLHRIMDNEHCRRRVDGHPQLPPTVEDLRQATQQLKATGNSGPGADGVPAALLKILSGLTLENVYDAFRARFLNPAGPGQEVPAWRRVWVRSTPKPRRPISAIAVFFNFMRS